MMFEYTTNNSGGFFWLTTADWEALAAAGWVIDTDHTFDGEFLRATAEFGSMQDAIASFELATGQDYYERGCDCCGVPHFIFEIPEEWA